MRNQLSMPAIEAITDSQRGAVDSFVICDMAGFAEAADSVPGSRRERSGSWCGGMSFNESLACVRAGDLSAVPESEKLLSEMESHVFVARRFRIIDDVTGALPNVPAYLAGVPANMRRRVRTVSPAAPLSVFVDLTSSAGISADDVRKRGTAILALVRLLANVRPVEIWAFVGLGSQGRANYVAVRLDTAPLDLARAAHMLTHASVARALGYGIAEHALRSQGGWPYGNVELQRKHGAAIMSRVVNPGSDVLFMPPIHLSDASVKNPVKWIRDMLAQYGGNVVENAD
jgi:hypothetical protein